MLRHARDQAGAERYSMHAISGLIDSALGVQD
jgi:hypothetical protein